jgi:hypothetical protein
MPIAIYGVSDNLGMLDAAFRRNSFSYNPSWPDPLAGGKPGPSTNSLPVLKDEKYR